MRLNYTFIVLVSFLIMTLSVEAAPLVKKNTQTFIQNIFTLFWAQSNLTFCIVGSTWMLLLGDQGGYFNRCFDNFISTALFY
eukprot:403334321